MEAASTGVWIFSISGCQRRSVVVSELCFMLAAAPRKKPDDTSENQKNQNNSDPNACLENVSGYLAAGENGKEANQTRKQRPKAIHSGFPPSKFSPTESG